MKNFFCTKFKSSSSSDEQDRSRAFNVDEEYLQAFRTKSYIEISDEIQRQREMAAADTSSSSPECLLEPGPELLNGAFGTFKIHHLLINYFEASLEAYKSCEMILKTLHQTRTNHTKIRRVIKLAKRVSVSGDGESRHYSAAIFRELSSFSQLENPVKLRALHDSHFELLQKLTNKGKEIQRKLKIRRVWKKVIGVGFVITNTVAVITLLILAFHTVAGVVIAPGLVGCFISLLLHKKHRKKLAKEVSVQLLAMKQMDIAAKSVYIMMNDFDTLSRMVARLEGEVEQLKAIAKMCIRSRRWEIVKEAAKEFVAADGSIVKQMEEVEQHIYLCFLTINRSRRLVMQEIAAGQHQNG